MYNGRNIWLIKPNDFNRGRGVSLFNTLEDLRRLLSEFTNGTCTDFFVNHACAQIMQNEKHLQLSMKNQEYAIPYPGQEMSVHTDTIESKEILPDPNVIG